MLPSIQRSARALGLAAATLLALAATPAHAIRVTSWNIWQYPQSHLAIRQPNFRTVMAHMQADVIILQEINSTAGRDSFLNNVLNVVEPGQWAHNGWISVGAGEGMAMLYKPSKVTAVGAPTPFATDGPRDVIRFRVRPVGTAASSAILSLYSLHLKAGAPSPTCSPMPCIPDSAVRRLEGEDLRNELNTLAPGTSFMVGGDYNFYGDWEGGYIFLTESQPDNDGRCQDPIVGMVGQWNQSFYAHLHTQSPCASGCPSGFSTGGLDDRFDLWLPSTSMFDGEGLDYVVSTYAEQACPFMFGNDGQHYDANVDAGGVNTAVPIAVATALRNSSDHLPIVMIVQIPARVLAASQLDFGTVIVGASAQQTLSVSNPASPPADELTYSLAAPADFTAPGGTFTVNAGAPAALHSVGMSTVASGVKSGTLTMTTDDPDSLSKGVLLSGRVLDHAVASLDSSQVVVGVALDFGDHLSGQFTDMDARVHDFGYDPLQARLAVQSGSIVGGGGRFSIVGGFSAALLAETGKTYTVHFDDTGATQDSTYNATLTFASADEPLPGASAATDLVVTLRARALSGSVGVPGEELPKHVALLPPRPNPSTGIVRLGFELPREAPVTLAVFDPSGRRMATLASGTYPAGRHALAWNATAEGGGRAGAGLYFVRFSTPGLSRTARLIVLP